MRNFLLILILTILILFPTLAPAQKIEKLALYIPFDEGTGNEVKDSGPLKLKGKIVGTPKWVKGKFENALEFEGPNAQYVDFGYQKELEADTAVTVMVWVFTKDWKSATCCHQVYGFGIHGGCGGRVQHGMFAEGDLLKIRFEATGGELDVGAPPPEVNKWVHVAATYDNGTGRIYVDGKLAGEGKSGGALSKSNEPFFIAADCERLNYSFNGTIDEFIMFLRVLDEKEISQTMQKGLLAVETAGKLATSWGEIRRSY